MAKLKFELFITTEKGQESFVLDHKPIMLGSGGNCDVKIGSGDPVVKAILQEEEGVLLVKVFDNAFPISINGKKYKTARIKNSAFFKIGNIDIVASIEEVVEAVVSQEIHEVFDDSEELADYVEEVREPSRTNIKLPKLPTNTFQPESLPEAAAVNAKHVNIISDKKKHHQSVDSAATVELEAAIEEDFFKFNIHFNEESYTPTSSISYSNQNFDYSSYIDLKDETVKELPEEILEPVAGHCLHIVHMNNGIVVKEEHFDPQVKRIYVSNEYSDKKTMQILDCGQYKNELIFVRDRKVFVVEQPGFLLQKVDKNEKLTNCDTASVQLLNEERIVLSKGTSQIIINIVPTPPRILHKNFFDFDDELVKITAKVWATCIIPLLLILLLAEVPQEKPKIKKELVVIYKKKKIKKPERKEVEKPEQTAKAASAQSEKKKIEPAKKPENKVAKKEPVKKTKVVKKVVAKANPAKNKQKIAKTKPNKVVAKRVTKRKSIVKAAPKKTYKFSSSSKMSAVLGSNNTKLKTARTTSSVDVASTLGSSSTLTKNFNSNKFGKSGVRVENFGSGSPNGSRAGTGTSGLSGKSGASTAYIEASTKILGAMDPELIRKIMREYIPQFRYCYQRELMKNPKVAGTFDLIFQINAYGKGTNVDVKKNGREFSNNGKGCLKRVVKMIRFPKPKGGGLVDVRQPMNFYKQ